MKRFIVILLFLLVGTLQAQMNMADVAKHISNINSTLSTQTTNIAANTASILLKAPLAAPTFTGTATFSGIALATSSTHVWATGGSVVLATAGTDAACSDGDRYWTEITIPHNITITGVSYLVGSVGGTDSVVVQLFNSAGVQVATSRAVGGAAVIVGTTAEFQSVAFTATYDAIPGLYYIAVQFNGTTAKFRTYPIAGSPFVAGTASGTWGTAAAITPGTTFTADKGPICITY